MISVGKRNLVQRMAQSRMARDVHSLGRSIGIGLAAVAFVLGVMVIVEMVIQIVAPAIARMLGWL